MIELITGPMFSSKTTTLLSKLERAVIARKRVVLIRPIVDTRKFLMHSSENDLKIDDRIIIVTTDDLLNLNTDEFDVIGIDEGQFHNHLKSFCVRELKDKKQIYIAALNATSEQVMFKEIIDIFPYCDEIIKLNAVCMKTGNDVANYTHYIGNGIKKDDVLVGNTEEYEALCFDAAEEFFEEDKIDD
jgi:thymidine kinase